MRPWFRASMSCLLPLRRAFMYGRFWASGRLLYSLVRTNLASSATSAVAAGGSEERIAHTATPAAATSTSALTISHFFEFVFVSPFMSVPLSPVLRLDRRRVVVASRAGKQLVRRRRIVRRDAAVGTYDVPKIL